MTSINLRRSIFIIALLAPILSFFCCKPENNYIEVISIDPTKAKNINLSLFVDTVKYIVLETNPHSMLGSRISRIEVKEKYIYVGDIDQQAVFIFDKTGRYITKLAKQGRGPDEYLRFGHFLVDEKENHIDMIEFSGRYNRLLRYNNLTFDLITIDTLPAITAYTVRRVDDVYFFGNQRRNNLIDNELVNADIIIVKDGKIKKILFQNPVTDENNFFSVNPETFTINDDNEIFASILYDNVFYQIKNYEAIPIFEVDFGRYNFNNEIKFENTSRQIDYWSNNPYVASFPVLNVNNSKLFSFSYGFDKIEHQYIVIKNTDKTIHAKAINNDLTGFPENITLSSNRYGINHDVWQNGYINDIFIPGVLISEKDSVYLPGAGTINSRNNPVIVRMRLRK